MHCHFYSFAILQLIQRPVSPNRYDELSASKIKNPELLLILTQLHVYFFPVQLLKKIPRYLTTSPLNICCLPEINTNVQFILWLSNILSFFPLQLRHNERLPSPIPPTAPQLQHVVSSTHCFIGGTQLTVVCGPARRQYLRYIANATRWKVLNVLVNVWIFIHDVTRLNVLNVNTI